MRRRDFISLLRLLLGTPALGAGPDASRAYWRLIRRKLRRLRGQLPAIDLAGERLADRVASGGLLYIYDARGEYVAEALGRAGGLMAIQSIGPGETARLGASDAVLLVADAPADPGDVSLARGARAAGALVVGLCPVRAEGTAAVCDVAIDNLTGDAQGAGAPVAGVMNTALLWAVTAAYIEAMERRAKPPHVWMSIKRPRAREFNAAAQAATQEAGY